MRVVGSNRGSLSVCPRRLAKWGWGRVLAGGILAVAALCLLIGGCHRTHKRPEKPTEGHVQASVAPQAPAAFSCRGN
jgi:hypothetical protein